MTCQSDVIFWEKMKLASTHLNARELWKTEQNLNYFTWTTKYHDDMTWLMTICHHMTYVTWHTSYVKAWLMSIKFDIWLLVYVAVSKLERWFYFRFAQYLGREIHFYYRRLGDLHACIHAWPWNWRSRHGLRDLCYLCLYLSYRDDFFLFRKDFRSGNSFQLSPFAWP